jgi:DNA polymerase III subunit gamma/tau
MRKNLVLLAAMDNYIVSARKYRPENFSSVVGQASITHTLKNAIKNKHLGHAYLFCGPRGVGKTTCARIFAKAINCTSLTEDTEPCNECESCQSFNQSRAFNIHELDAASNNSVEDIRNLTEQVRIPPQVGRYSIYIIDEVHMLSAQAFNAFLKTLEEPPAHAIFILATTEKHKIIPTILSRCQIYDFNRIRVADIVSYLEFISKEEKVEFELEALNVIALKADGAMRDALSIFDQVLSFAGKNVSYSTVIENLNILDYEYYFNMTNHFLNGDIPAALMLVDEILEKGFDAHNFLNGLSSHIRDLLVCRDPVTLDLLEVGAGIRDRYQEQCKLTSQEWLYRALDILGSSDISFKASRNQRLHTELTLLKLCQLSNDGKKKVLTESEPEPEQEAESSPEPASDSSSEPVIESSPEPAVGSSLEPEPEILADGKSESRAQQSSPGPKPGRMLSIKDALNGVESPKDKVDNKQSEEPAREKKSSPFTFEELLDQWNAYAEKIRDEKPRMASSLKHHLPSIKDELRIEVALSNSTQFDQFNREIKPGLVTFLESSLNNNQFTIEPVVLETEEKQNSLYTSEEKFEHMVKKNPNLGKLKERFNLDFE